MHTPSFEEWLIRAPRALRVDSLWKATAYRQALYAVDIAWNDALILDRARITRPIASQLYRALGSISTNIGEGYSRSSGLDRARQFEYALGSTRESTAWYFAAIPVLGLEVFTRREETLSQIRRLLLTTIPTERQRSRLHKG